MSEEAKKIIANIATAMQQMTEAEKERLAGFGEGMAYMAEKRKAGKEENQQ